MAIILDYFISVIMELARIKLAKFVDKSKNAVKKISQAATDAMSATLMLMLRDAKLNISRGSTQAVDTGRLRGSISINWDTSTFTKGKVQSPAKGDDGILKPQKKKGSTIGIVGSNVEYAPYVELGTVHMKARPFLRKSIEKHRSQDTFAKQLKLRSAT